MKRLWRHLSPLLIFGESLRCLVLIISLCTLYFCSAGHLQWKTSEAFVAENYVMPFGPPACNPFLGGMQMGVYGDIMHYSIPMPPYMGYISGVFCHQDPYGVGGYGYTISAVPQSQRYICCILTILVLEYLHKFFHLDRWALYIQHVWILCPDFIV